MAVKSVGCASCGPGILDGASTSVLTTAEEDLIMIHAYLGPTSGWFKQDGAARLEVHGMCRGIATSEGYSEGKCCIPSNDEVLSRWGLASLAHAADSIHAYLIRQMQPMMLQDLSW